MDRQATIISDGYGYLEAARWREGRLYFSDIGKRRVHRMAPGGPVETLLTVPARPSGLGWAANGDLLVVAMEDNRLNRVGPNGETKSSIALDEHLVHANDMAVDAAGRAYITQFGYDLFDHAPPEPAGLITIAPDGTVTAFGEGLIFPNGIAISPDGRTLVVAESFGYRLAAFTIGADGIPRDQRVFAELGGDENNVLDGICIDSEGAVWVGMPFAGEFRRIVDGGEVTDIVRPAPGHGDYCVDCILGGEGGRTLFLLVADTDVERMARDWDSEASVQAVEVAVPG